jgi:hypothetical protein
VRPTVKTQPLSKAVKSHSNPTGSSPKACVRKGKLWGMSKLHQMLRQVNAIPSATISYIAILIQPLARVIQSANRTIQTDILGLVPERLLPYNEVPTIQVCQTSSVVNTLSSRKASAGTLLSGMQNHTDTCHKAQCYDSTKSSEILGTAHLAFHISLVLS